MFITSASRELTETQLARWPLSGSVLRAETTHRGRPANLFTTPVASIGPA
jgi:hypothetical protein